MFGKKTKIEEKSLSDNSIEFSYQQEKSFLDIFKKFKVDLPSLIVLIFISIAGVLVYLNNISVNKEYEQSNIEYEEVVEKYDNLKEKMAKVKDIKINKIEGNQLVKIFDFLKKLDIDYKLSQSKKNNKYEVFINNYDIDKLQKLIQEGIDEGILDSSTKKEFIISSPGKASIKLIFKQ